MANTGEIEVGPGAAVVIKQSSVVCGHREKKGRAIPLNIRVNAGGSWASRREDRGRSAGEREVAGVAEAIGKK